MMGNSSQDSALAEASGSGDAAEDVLLPDSSSDAAEASSGSIKQTSENPDTTDADRGSCYGCYTGGKSCDAVRCIGEQYLCTAWNIFRTGNTAVKQ